MTAPVLPGAEPFAATGGPDGALVLHGFTGNPSSMRGLAEKLADAGFTVELPLLPGHGTSVDDMLPTRWADWSGAAEQAYTDLAARCARVAVVALSMGGTLACWLAERHAEICGLVLVNPLVQAPTADLLTGIHALLEAGVALAPGVGSDIADPDATELAYDGAPLEAALSLFEAAEEVGARLGDVRCPVLLFSSRDDHVVAPANGERVATGVGGPLERVLLDRSYHVATLDYDRDEIEARTVAFVTSVTGAGQG